VEQVDAEIRLDLGPCMGSGEEISKVIRFNYYKKLVI
jgi:hypothetical protein